MTARFSCIKPNGYNASPYFIQFSANEHTLPVLSIPGWPFDVIDDEDAPRHLARVEFQP